MVSRRRLRRISTTAVRGYSRCARFPSVECLVKFPKSRLQSRAPFSPVGSRWRSSRWRFTPSRRAFPQGCCSALTANPTSSLVLLNRWRFQSIWLVAQGLAMLRWVCTLCKTHMTASIQASFDLYHNLHKPINEQERVATTATMDTAILEHS